MIKKTIIAFLFLLPLQLLMSKPVIAEPLAIEQSPNIKVYAFEKVLDRWGDEQWSYFNDLIKRESNWNSNTQNSKSTAYGLGQFLNSTWSLVGCKKTSNSHEQIDCTIDYVEKIYGTPKKAIVFHNRNNYY